MHVYVNRARSDIFRGCPNVKMTYGWNNWQVWKMEVWERVEMWGVAGGRARSNIFRGCPDVKMTYGWSNWQVWRMEAWESVGGALWEAAGHAATTPAAGPMSRWCTQDDVLPDRWVLGGRTSNPPRCANTSCTASTLFVTVSPPPPPLCLIHIFQMSAQGADLKPTSPLPTHPCTAFTLTLSHFKSHI